MTTLEDKVKNWLIDHGFPLEMRVADILRRTGIHADHYRVYQDQATGKSREVDLLGYIDHSKICTHLVLECKHSRDKPWILFCTPHRVLTDAGYVCSFPSTPRAREAIEAVADSRSVQAMTIFNAPPLMGFRLLRAHTDNQDAAYHAVLGVVAASVSSAEALGQHGHSIVFPPVVVVDSPLLQCHLLPGNAELELTRVTRGVLFHPLGDGNNVLVQVVHVDALETFAVNVKREAAVLDELIPNIPRPARAAKEG